MAGPPPKGYIPERRSDYSPKAFEVVILGVTLRGEKATRHVGWSSDWTDKLDRLVAAGYVEWRRVAPDQDELYVVAGIRL